MLKGIKEVIAEEAAKFARIKGDDQDKAYALLHAALTFPGLAKKGIKYIAKMVDGDDLVKGVGKKVGEKALRNTPGKVTGSDNFQELAKIMRGSDGYVGLISKNVADNLKGKSFSNFDEFRSEFWKIVANSPHAKEFGLQNIYRMQKVYAPIARSSQQYKGLSKYVLHHKKPIQHGGGVYDLDNINIVSPRMHQEILAKKYHF